MKTVLFASIRLYQRAGSVFSIGSCRFVPTCSQYMHDAISTSGIISGLILGIKRILRCHPWGAHGYDPVPRKS